MFCDSGQEQICELDERGLVESQRYNSRTVNHHAHVLPNWRIEGRHDWDDNNWNNFKEVYIKTWARSGQVWPLADFGESHNTFLKILSDGLQLAKCPKAITSWNTSPQLKESHLKTWKLHLESQIKQQTKIAEVLLSASLAESSRKIAEALEDDRINPVDVDS